MRRIAISDLKAKLSEEIRRVKAGESIEVTDRGRAVARLVPLPERDDEEDLAALVRVGLVRAPAGPLAEDFWRRGRAEDADGLVLGALLEERGDSR
jgi:prevent-host-death family protein